MFLEIPTSIDEINSNKVILLISGKCPIPIHTLVLAFPVCICKDAEYFGPQNAPFKIFV